MEMKLSSLIKGISVLFVLLATITAVCVYELNEYVKKAEEARERQAEYKQLGIDLANASDYLTNEARRYVQFGEKKHFDNYWREVNETKTRDKVVARLKELNAPKEELDLLEQSKRNSDALIATEEAAMKAVARNDFTTARTLMFDEKYDANKEIIMAPLMEFQKKMNARVDKEAQQAKDMANTTLFYVNSLIALIVLSVLGTFIILYKKIQPLTDVSHKLTELAKNEGDLTSRLLFEGKDEVGEIATSFNLLLASLQQMIRDISTSAQSLACSTQQISASTDEIASGSQHQAQAATSVTELTKEMSRAIQEVAQSAEQAASLSEQTVEVAQQGERIVYETIQAMEKISSKMNELENKSTGIGEIIEVIDSIAEQTNLLALNAAIEAARAGESGKGFAVVAEEVRRLAERSSKATQEITTLVKGIQGNTEQCVEAVLSGNEKAQQAEKSFGRITTFVRDTSSKVTTIATSSEQQAAQSQEVIAAIENISATTQQMSAGTQETAATASELAKMAEKLQILTGRFTV